MTTKKQITSKDFEGHYAIIWHTSDDEHYINTIPLDSLSNSKYWCFVDKKLSRLDDKRFDGEIHYPASGDSINKMVQYFNRFHKSHVEFRFITKAECRQIVFMATL